MKNLNNFDSRIVEARQKGYALSDMGKEEYEASLTGIIFNVSVICGCQLPTHELHVNTLEKEFTVFINDYGYNILTVEEILTAFRMNANGQLEDKIETYGALFNIDFAARVLSQYRNKRWSLDFKLHEVYQKKENDKIFEQQENKRRLKVKEQFNKYLSDETAELDLVDCYMQLVHDNAFLNKFSDNIFLPQAKVETKRVGETKFGDLLLNSGIDLEASFAAGKMAVKYLFENMKKTGRVVIYDDNLKLLHPYFDIPEIKEKIIDEKDLQKSEM